MVARIYYVINIRKEDASEKEKPTNRNSIIKLLA